MKVDTMSVCSSEDGAPDGVLTLERKSVQPYATQDEYLYAMKEDLSEWFHTLYDLQISVDDFFEVLETGVPLCRHANNVQSFILEKLRETGGVAPAPRPGHRPVTLTLTEAVQFRENVKPGSFQSRDNVSNFITWCRGLGLPDCLLMETEDLVLRKNERSVVLCLLEVARQGARYGMAAPMLIQLEEEIDAEIAGEPPPPPTKHRPKIVCDLMSLDEMVREMLRKCTCPDQFPMIKVSDGKYRIGDSQTCIFVRILRNHVMVRIGGGWDTLEHYLDRHDPCRCTTKGHKTPRGVANSPRGSVAIKRRASAPSAPPPIIRSTTPEPTPSESTPSTQQQRTRYYPNYSGSKIALRSKRSQNLAGGQPGTPRSGAGGVDGVRRSHEARLLSPMPEDEVSPTKSNKMPKPVVPTRNYGNGTPTPRRGGAPGVQPEDSATRRQLFVPDSRQKQQVVARSGGSIPRGGGRSTPVSGASRNSSISDISQTSDDASLDNRACSSRGSSDSENVGHRQNGHTPRGRTQDQTFQNRGRSQERSRTPLGGTPTRGRSTERSANGTPTRGRSQERKPRQNRSHSLDPNEIKIQLSKTAPAAYNRKKAAGDQDNFIISRNKEGKHSITSQNNNQQSEADKRPQGRKTLFPVGILPDKPRPKISNRSQTIDMGSIENDPEPNEGSAQRRKKLSSSSSVSLSSYEDLPEPEPNPDLNEQMERLFEEYRKTELGLDEKQIPNIDIDYVDTSNNVNNNTKMNGNNNVVKSVISQNENKSFQRGRAGSRESIPGSIGSSSRPESPAPNKRRSSDSSRRSASPSPYNHRPASPAPMRRSPSPAPNSKYSAPPTPVSTSRRSPSPAPATNARSTASPQTPRRSVTPQPRGTPKQSPAPTSRAKGPPPVSSTGKGTAKQTPQSSAKKGPPASAPVSRRSSFCSVTSGTAKSTTTTKTNASTTATRTGTHPASKKAPDTSAVPATNSAPPTTPSGSSNTGDFGFIVDVQVDAPARGNILAGVPNDECKAERVAAFVDEVRAKMQKQPARPARSQSARPASARQTRPPTTTTQTSNKTRKDGPAKTPVAHQRASTASGIRSASPAPASGNRAQRSRSKEDLLDCKKPASNQTRGRSKSSPRITPLTVRAASPCNVQDREAQTVDVAPPSPERPGELVLQIPTSIPAPVKPRLDDRGGRRTRIPLPKSMSSNWKTSEPAPLRRYDSGVDINNMSPTDASLQGDENHWQQQGLLYSHEAESSQEYY